MDDHETAKKEYGSDRAQLVYGLTSDAALVHISEVQRGIACNCICPACKSKLVARTRGVHQVPHFAHYSGEACANGPETVLHLLAKQVFRSNPNMLLPERLALNERKQVVTKPVKEVETEFLRLEYSDPKAIIPDLYIRALGHDLFVEVAVTHFSGEQKIMRLRGHGVPAVEIDLSRVPRDSSRDTIAEAVLQAAPREWLFHPGIDAAKTKLLSDEEDRQAKLDKRYAAAAAERKRRCVKIIESYWDSLNELEEVSSSYVRQREIQEVGLAEHVGIEVAGFGCFNVIPTIWQSIILAEVFHDHCLGNEVRKSVPIVKHLEKCGLIGEPFKRLSGDLADEIETIEPDFAPPWKVVDAYLRHLVRVGVLWDKGYGKSLAPKLADSWAERSSKEMQRTRLEQSVANSVGWILAGLPTTERGNITVELWLDSTDYQSGMTYRELIQSQNESHRITAEIDSIVAMLEQRGPLPRVTLGLPIEGAIERRVAQMAKQAEEARARQIKDANRLRDTRRDKLCVDAEQVLSGPELARFLNMKQGDLNGMSPMEAAEESESGLSRARGLLANLALKRAREADEADERNRYRSMIEIAAKQCLPAESAESFLNGRDDDLARMTPAMFVKDEASYRAALKKLHEWKREFGSL